MGILNTADLQITKILLQSCRKLYSIQHLLAKRNQSTVPQNDPEKVYTFTLISLITNY